MASFALSKQTVPSLKTTCTRTNLTILDSWIPCYTKYKIGYDKVVQYSWWAPKFNSQKEKHLAPHSSELNPVKNFRSIMKSAIKRTKFSGTDDLIVKDVEVPKEMRR